MERDPHQAVYGIGVAAELVGMGVQTLRLYESRGLVSPARTDGGTRRYSDHDLGVLQRIGELLDDGLNLAGVAMVLQLEKDNARLRRRIEQREPGRRTGGDRGPRPSTSP